MAVDFAAAPVAREQNVAELLTPTLVLQVQRPHTGTATELTKGRHDLIWEIRVMLRVTVVSALKQMAHANVPTARTVVVVVACEQIHERIHPDVERVSQPRGKDLQVGPIGPDTSDPAAHRDRAAVLASRHRRTVVANGDVDPAVESHTNAVGGVIAAALIDHVAGQTRHEDLGPFRDAI